MPLPRNNLALAYKLDDFYKVYKPIEVRSSKRYINEFNTITKAYLDCQSLVNDYCYSDNHKTQEALSNRLDIINKLDASNNLIKSTLVSLMLIDDKLYKLLEEPLSLSTEIGRIIGGFSKNLTKKLNKAINDNITGL